MRFALLVTMVLHTAHVAVRGDFVATKLFNWTQPAPMPNPDPLFPVKDGIHNTGQEKTHLRFHWVISACDARPHWSRTLLSTIASGFLNDVFPATISIAWCKPRSSLPNPMPSLFTNLKLSRKVNVFFMPSTLDVPADKQRNNPVTCWLALSVPSYLGLDELPLLLTEDDVAFAPRFNWQLQQALQSMAPEDAAVPYLVTAYTPEDPAPMADMLARLAARHALWGEAAWPPTSPPKVDKTHRSFWFGNQGLFFSPDMTQNAAVQFHEVLTGVRTERIQEGGSDMVLVDLLRNRADCIVPKHLAKELQRLKDNLVKSAEVALGSVLGRHLAADGPARRCAVLHTVPSLVQHVGVTSALFNNTNPTLHKFHVSMDFRGQLGFPAHDVKGTWQRSHQPMNCGTQHCSMERTGEPTTASPLG